MQCDALRETNEELRCAQMQQDHLSQTGTALSSETLLFGLEVSLNVLN